MLVVGNGRGGGSVFVVVSWLIRLKEEGVEEGKKDGWGGGGGGAEGCALSLLGAALGVPLSVRLNPLDIRNPTTMASRK